MPSLLLCALLLWSVISPVAVQGFASIGDFISEKLLGNGATTDSVMHLGDGTNERIVLGSGPVIATYSMTNPQGGATSSASLRGALTSFNGMPRADVWFAWGYSPATMTNLTPVVTITSAGVQSVTVSGLATGQTVYYQMRASTDGTSIGATVSFVAGGGQGVGYWLLRNLLTLSIAAGIFVLVIVSTGNPVYALLGALIGLVAVFIVRAMLNM